MKKIFLLSIVFLVCIEIVAQDKKMATTISEVGHKVIRMPKFSIADLPKKSIAIADISIMQNVRDSLRLGFVLKGPDNQVAEIITKKTLTPFLQDHIYELYEDDFKKGGVKMFWVIKDLRIGEKTSKFAEYSYLRFNADAYISREDSIYNFIATIDTVFASSSGADVTAWHGAEIEDALKLLLKISIKNDADKSFVRGENLTKLQIVENGSMEKLLPILTAETYADGAYRTFNEFLNNSPSISNFEMSVVNKNTLVCLAENKMDTLNVWGLCKKGELYKFEEGALIPLEKYGKGFIISDFIKKVNRKNANAFAAAVIGGLAGSLLQSSLSNKRLFLVKTIPQITKKRMQPDATCIDMETGELSF